MRNQLLFESWRWSKWQSLVVCDCTSPYIGNIQWLLAAVAVPLSPFAQHISVLTEIFSGLAQPLQVDKLTTKPAMYIIWQVHIFQFGNPCAFILGNFGQLYKAYLHFLNISEQYLFRNTSCTKMFNFGKSLKKSATWQEKCGFADAA